MSQLLINQNLQKRAEVELRIDKKYRKTLVAGRLRHFFSHVHRQEAT